MDGLTPPLLLSPTALADPRALAGDTRNIEAAAQGFESMFASLLIKQLRESLQPDTMFGQDRGDVLGGMFDMYLGQHLARSESLGIGALVRKQLTQARASHEPTHAQAHS